MVSRAAALLAALALGGCALPLVPPPGTLSGRLSVQVEAVGERAAQSISAGFELQGDADRGTLRLSTALGTTLATAHWDTGEARLVTAQGEQHFVALEDLSVAAFGEALPLRALPDWLRGRPWPGAAAQVTAAPGFDQLGWTIDLARFGTGYLLAWRVAAAAVLLRAKLDDAP